MRQGAKVLYDELLLAPKLLFSGIGWAMGLQLAGILGAGFGDAFGTFLGCIMALLMEITVRYYRKNFEDFHLFDLLKFAVILFSGSFACGLIFNIALDWASVVCFGNEIGITITTALISSTLFLVGLTFARAFFQNKEFSISLCNFKKDFELSFTIILCAEIGFVGTSFPILGEWFTGPEPSKAGIAAALGGCAADLFIKAFKSLRIIYLDMVVRRNLNKRTLNLSQ